MECDGECPRATVAVPMMTAFVAAAGIFDEMSGLNTYCSETMPQRRDVIASKYLVRYMFSAAASAAAVPLMDAMGFGPPCTLGKLSGPRELSDLSQRWIYSRYWFRSCERSDDGGHGAVRLSPALGAKKI